MATYALTFATRAAFDTSLASGDIYNLMQGVTSSKPSVAITATITESGETFACGTNVMVDIKSVGPGDYVMYDSTNNKYFGIASKWIDNNYPAQPTQHIMIFKAGVLPARYVVCGTVVKRFGNRIRLAGENTTKIWCGASASDYSWYVPDIPSNTYVIKKARATTTAVNIVEWCSFGSLRYQENNYASGNAVYFPITRATWNAALAAGNETVTQNGKTANMSDYDYDFDRYLAANFAPLWPAAQGVYSDTDGRKNTRKIVENFVANHGKSATSADYAAGYCLNYSINAPGLGRGNWYLGVISEYAPLIALSYMMVVPFAWGSSRIWSSSQSASNRSWDVNNNGFINQDNKINGYMVIPLAELILEN